VFCVGTLLTSIQAPQTGTEAGSCSVARESARAEGTQRASIYNPSHKSPDAEELETPTVARPLSDTEALEGTTFVGTSAPGS